MKFILNFTSSAVTALLLSACLGSSSNPVDPPEPSNPDPEPPITGDIIRYHHLGLDTFAVESLYQAGDSVWAAGAGGIYVSRNLEALNQDQANWQLQLAGFHFSYITGFDATTLFAIGVPENPGLNELYRSTDSGANWTEVKHDFANANDVEQSSMTRLLADQATGYLYAVGADLLAISYNQGENWEPLHGEPGFIARNFSLSLNSQYNDLWWGGQDAVERMTMNRFSLNDQAHTHWQALFPSPATVEDIVFDRTNPDRVLFGAEGGIALSENYGLDWDAVITDDHAAFYMAIEQSSRYPEVWYSARWEKLNEQHPLMFEYSTDRGYSWQRSTHPQRAGHDGVRDMVLLQNAQDGQDILWLGLQSGTWEGGGVMRVAVDLEVFNERFVISD